LALAKKRIINDEKKRNLNSPAGKPGRIEYVVLVKSEWLCTFLILLTPLNVQLVLKKGLGNKYSRISI